MSLAGFQDYTDPLVLNCLTTINETFNAKNVYVSGIITGSGASSNILGTDNVWTGLNDFQNTTTYTGTDSITSSSLIQKKQIDDAVSGYNPLPTSNKWDVAPVFSNALPPTSPDLVGTNYLPNRFYNYNSLVNYISANPSTIPSDNVSKTFTGTNTFVNFVGGNDPVGSLPISPQEAAIKEYVDAKIEVSGKTLTYTITTPGFYSFQTINRTLIAKIEFWLFGGSCDGKSGAVVGGVIGNGLGNDGSLTLLVGTTANPIEVYTSQGTAVPSTTYLSVSNLPIYIAGGACNFNGTTTPGIFVPGSFSETPTTAFNGKVGNNELAYSNVLGTATSAGGAILIAHYL